MTKKRLEVSDRWIKLSQTKTWIDILEEMAKRIPWAEALVFEDERVNYMDYLRNVYEYAKGLHSIGVRRGDHVGLWMTNRPEWCYARFAINKLGAIMIPISTRYRVDDLDYILSQSDAQVLIMEPKFLAKINSMEMINQLCPELAGSKPGQFVSKKFPLLKTVICVNGSSKGFLSMDEVLQKGKEVSDNDFQSETKPDDIIHIIYTSGTTAFPKGIMTPGTINVAFSVISGELFNLKEGDRYLNVLPFFGNIGLSTIQWCLLAGATLVMTNRFSPIDTFKLLKFCTFLCP